MKFPVLIADACADAREDLMQAMPDDWNVTLSEVSTAPEALTACSEGQVSVLFLDLTLPGMTGLELMEALQRANTATAVIVVSQDLPAETKSQAKVGGAMAFIEKPVRRDALESVLKGCGLYEEMI